MAVALPRISNEIGTSEPVDVISIFPEHLNYGVVSCGFYYNLEFSIQNNSLAPIRVRINASPDEGEMNGIRLIHLPDKIAPGMSISLTLELTAELPGQSTFTLAVTTNADSKIHRRLIEANIITPETFKYVKKSLQLQKRPIFRRNVHSVGALPGGDAGSVGTPVTSLSETMIMDDEDIDDLLDMPMVANTYWDPFDKVMRLDPLLGKVVVNKNITLEESLQDTALERAKRLHELEEQGFFTQKSMERMREQRTLTHTIIDTNSVSEASQDSAELGTDIDSPDKSTSKKVDLVLPKMEDGMASGMVSARSSLSKLVSVSSLLALKREKIEQQRRATVMAASEFAKSSRTDSMVNSQRTLNMIEGRKSKVQYL